MSYSLMVYRSIFEGDPPAYAFTLGPEQITVESITTSNAGGYVQAVVTLKAPMRDGDFPPAAHCEIYWDGGFAFEGLLRRPSIAMGKLSRLELAGYGQLLLDRNPWDTSGLHSQTEHPVPMTVAMRMALARQPLVRVSEPFGENWTPQ